MIRRHFCVWLGRAAPTNVNYERVFTDERVQNLLKRLGGMDPSKVFRHRAVAKQESPLYVLASKNDIRKMEEQVQRRCEQRLRIPPFKMTRDEESCTILAQDEEISGFDNANLIFMDTSPRLEPQLRDRLIVVREKGGTLRTAKPAERDRMYNLFYPTSPEKRTRLPLMFSEPFFETVLKLRRYELILDSASQVLEPDDTKYIQIVKRVYDQIDEERNYATLWSTRYYGHMIFYLVVAEKHERLLEYYFTSDTPEARNSAVDLIHVFYACHPERAPNAAATVDTDSRPLDVLEYYVKNTSKNESLTKEYEEMIRRLQRNSQSVAENRV